MLRNLSIQLVVFFLIFQALSFLRETSMLSLSSTLDDEVVSLATLMGETINIEAKGKTTVIYFFAPWCQVCHVSIGNLQNIYEKNQHVNVIAVVMDYSSIDEVTAFTQQHQLTFPIALGNEAIKKQFQITGYPSYYVLDEQNTITGRSLGYSSELGLYLRSL